MKISAIKQQINDSNRASIFIDGSYGFSLSLDQLISEKLKKGLELDESRIKVLKQKSIDGKVRARFLEWLNIRPRSVQESKLYLKKKKIDPGYVDNLINEMQKLNFLSDENFSRWYIGVKSRQLKSDKELKFILKQKGISQENINSSFEQYAGDETLRLKEIINKKRQNSRYQDREKLIAYLVRKGYSFSDVKDALTDV